MAFTVREFHDLVRILDDHPEWREELRRRVLTDEVLSLPLAVRELAEAQRQTQAEVRQLAEAQRRTEEQVQALTARVDDLAEAQRQTQQEVKSLAEAQRQTQQEVKSLAEAQRQTQVEVRALAEAMQKMAADVGRLKHWGLEQQYRLHAPAYFGRLLRGLRTFSSEELARLLDQALDEGRLSQEDRSDILLADLVIQGRPWKQPEQEAYLAVEVSWGIGMDDVERAVRRAGLLGRLMSPAFPAVAGTWLTPDAKDMADAMKVVQITDGVVNTPAGWPGA